MATIETTERAAQRETTACGVWAPAMTPLDADLMPDLPRAVAHVKWLLENGCHGVGIFGTTGEANSFSVEERMAVLEAVIAAGVAPERLMVGTGLCALTDSVRLSAHAAGLGCKSLLMLPPFYYKGVSDEGLAASFSEVIQRVGDSELEIFLYHFPKLSGVQITHGLVELLLKAYPKNVVGLKDSSGDAAGCAAYIETFPELAVFPGTEAIQLDMLEKGGVGTISATANINPGQIRKVYDAFAAGDDAAAGAQQETVTAVRLEAQKTPTIATLKPLLARHLNDDAWRRLRPPLMALSADQEADMIARLEAAGLVIGAG
ncbi:MAG: dihydrodipicolinate synthase family protein [Pseudomonadota bacterium]